ncbi:hypothetical protein [Candidatus Ichthyocystis sparus]|uniref:hypothetical protein n=1 Tax=Candidatus Ichthyocystis sparus TaxID=1561004 RepID=UPI000B8A5D77|nr:hypothetical protein [Candidatus Ichthyocystis sparus]
MCEQYLSSGNIQNASCETLEPYHYLTNLPNPPHESLDQHYYQTSIKNSSHESVGQDHYSTNFPSYSHESPEMQPCSTNFQDEPNESSKKYHYLTSLQNTSNESSERHLYSTSLQKSDSDYAASEKSPYPTSSQNTAYELSERYPYSTDLQNTAYESSERFPYSANLQNTAYESSERYTYSTNLQNTAYESSERYTYSTNLQNTAYESSEKYDYSTSLQNEPSLEQCNSITQEQHYSNSDEEDNIGFLAVNTMEQKQHYSSSSGEDTLQSFSKQKRKKEQYCYNSSEEDDIPSFMEHTMEQEQYSLDTKEEDTASNIERYAIPEKLQLITPHYRCAEVNYRRTVGIYEYVIKSIEIDNNRSYENFIITNLAYQIKNKGLDPSSIDLSFTHSMVRKYIADKISSRINNIMLNTDVVIAPGMSPAIVKSACISNHLFFKRLFKCCKDVLMEIKKIDHEDFLPITQIKFCFRGYDAFLFARTKDLKFSLSHGLKKLIVDTIIDLPQKIINEIKKLKNTDVLNRMFSLVHGVHISRSALRTANFILHSVQEKVEKTEIDNIKDYMKLLNEFSPKLEEEVSRSVVLYGEKIFSLNKYTAESMVKYLLEDIKNACSKPTKAISSRSGNKTRDKNLSSRYNCTKVKILKSSPAIDGSLVQLKAAYISKTSSCKWDPFNERQESLFKMSFAMIEIDLESFKTSLIDKSYKKYLLKRQISEVPVSPRIKIMFGRVKDHILGQFYPFLDEIEEEIKSKVELLSGMSIEQIKSSYISNCTSSQKLSKLCDKIVRNTKICHNAVLYGIMPATVKWDGVLKDSSRIHFSDTMKNSLIEDVRKSLIDNILSAPIKAFNIIKLLPESSVIPLFFSLIGGYYVDNRSLMRATEIFEYTRKKILIDRELMKSMSRIVKKLILLKKVNDASRSNMCALIDNFIVDKSNTSYSYLKKLSERQSEKLERTLRDPVMIISGNKVLVANEKIKDKILSRLKRSLISKSIITYRNLCIKNAGIIK